VNIFVLASVLSGTFVALWVLISMCFRIVVSTNEVHIVQSGKKSTAYGKDQTAGNTYYKWPSWVPIIGVKTIALPVSNFDVPLNGYEAYDKGRLPFQVDVMAFFRVENAVLAAQRISNFEELKEQMGSIVQGACRAVLATSDIEQILEGRSEFGERFTKEVDHNLANWGVATVKNIEFMDIRDSKESKVIHNIMAKKKSEIEMQSRTTVANNLKMADLAEIEAKQQVSVRAQEAEQQIGIRTAQKEQEVGIAREKS
jgi:flotillin